MEQGAVVGRTREQEDDIEYWMTVREEHAKHNQRYMTTEQIAWCEAKLGRKTQGELAMSYRGSGFYGRGAYFFLRHHSAVYVPYPARIQVHKSIVEEYHEWAVEQHARGLSVLGGPLN